MTDPKPVDPERVDDDESRYIGAAERLPREEWSGSMPERVPVYEHPDCEPYKSGPTYCVPGVRPDGSVVEFIYIFEGAFDPEEDAYIWTD